MTGWDFGHATAIRGDSLINKINNPIPAIMSNNQRNSNNTDDGVQVEEPPQILLSFIYVCA